MFVAFEIKSYNNLSGKQRLESLVTFPQNSIINDNTFGFHV